ncbi:hypothetical protein CHUAL_004413 [Chamberlinius hualienensis]
MLYHILQKGLLNGLKTELYRYSVSKMSSTTQCRKLVAVCQLNSSNDKKANLHQCQQLIEESTKKGAKMIFLPEAFDYIATSIEESVKMSEPLNGHTMKFFQDLSKNLKVWLSLGGFHQKDSANTYKLRNSHVILNDEGEIVSVYDKTHLFDVDIYRDDKKIRLKESDFTLPGEKIVKPIETPVGKVGLAICYDLRFPELSLLLTKLGADILTYPSAFTKITGQAHWELLLRNKAIENQCYVIAAAQTGQHNEKRASYGHSMIIDPWGKVLASCKEEIGIAICEIDLEMIRKVREELPVWQHRRSDLYQLNYQCKQQKYPSKFEFGSVVVGEKQIFYHTSSCVAFVNIKPVVPGHVLVAPFRKVARFSELTAVEVGQLFICAQTVQKIVELEYGATSSTITVQDGVDAGQTIKHVHVHVMPRKPGDFIRVDDVYIELENLDKRLKRSEAEMAEEAEKLRIRATKLA